VPDLSPDLLLSAYSEGWFPMCTEPGEIRWFSPDPRGILPLDTFHVPHGLKKTLRAGRFEVRINTAFDRVIAACADRLETWIDPAISASYRELHRLGFAHSVEAWSPRGLAGGLYGVCLAGAFFGESMFHRETDASKVALHALVTRLQTAEFALLDIQWTTPHLEQFGAIAVPRREYLRRLRAALKRADLSFA
jgi:leucyl/phenylalanyl-tRNA--protein transferase